MISYSVMALTTFPEVKSGDSINELLDEAFAKEGYIPEDKDILVLAHKIVSKAEGRIVELKDIVPSDEAIELSNLTGKDPRQTELILRESSEILYAAEHGLVIAHQRLGYVCANAAIDSSNAGKERFILLPVDPDASACSIRKHIKEKYDKTVGVVICDTHGRPFYKGAAGTLVGASGVELLKSYIGKTDRDGYVMKSSVEATGDELASAATLIMGQCEEGRPVAIIRGLDLMGEGSANDIIREEKNDVFLKALKNQK